MRNVKDSFRHESLQDADTIQELLAAVCKGFAKGKLTFSDEDGEIVMTPAGLLNLKLTANKEGGRHRVSIRVTWQVDEGKNTAKKSLRIA